MESVASRAVLLAAALRADAEFIQQVRQLHEHLRVTASAVDDRAHALEVLAAALAARRAPKTEPVQPEIEQKAAGISEEVATRWLQAGRLLRRSIDQLRGDAVTVTDQTWRDRLAAFMEAADQTLQRVPFAELEDAVGRVPMTPVPAREESRGPDATVFADAGFDTGGELFAPSREFELAVTEASRALRDYSNELARYTQALLTAPLVQLEGAESALLDALTRFELARRLKQPLERAQVEMLTKLLSGPLEPLLTELIAALTRFEWYFHPLKMSVSRGNIRLSGMATASEELDVRMLLNAGERAVITIAWFLALHLLQPESDRKVLVLDDPFSTLDENNQAALIATVRALTRLTRPDLLVLSSHDRTVADALEREFGAIDGWPSTTTRIRFSRAPDGTSRADGAPAESPEPDYEQELTRLGIAGRAQLVLGSD